MLSVLLSLVISLAAVTPDPPVPANWQIILNETREKTAHTSAHGSGTFAAKTSMGFVTVGITAATAPGKLYICTGRFLWAPSVTILVGRRNTFLLFNDEQQGMSLKSNDDRLILESTGYDLGLTPRDWSELVAGRLPHLVDPIASASDDRDRFWVIAEASPDMRYLLDAKEKQLLLVEDKKHGWQLIYGGWIKLDQGEIPTVWRLILQDEEKLVVHLYQVEAGTKGFSFLPPYDFVIYPYQPSK